jgi:hypothetical protein
MTSRIASALAFTGTAAAALMAATVMTTQAHAETPYIADNSQAFHSTRSRAEVKAEVLRDRKQLSSAGYEWAMQQNTPASGPYADTAVAGQPSTHTMAMRGKGGQPAGQYGQ